MENMDVWPVDMLNVAQRRQFGTARAVLTRWVSRASLPCAPNAKIQAEGGGGSVRGAQYDK